MPLYEYECDACGHRFEVIQKFSDPLVEVCPKCGSTVRKLFASPAIQFKGTGWYITDYARKDSGAAAKNDKAEKSENAGNADKAEKRDKSEKSEGAAAKDSSSGGEATSKGDKSADTSASSASTQKKDG